MKALIIGATGATGKDLVNVLLQDTEYSAVVQFARRTIGMAHPNEPLFFIFDSFSKGQLIILF